LTPARLARELARLLDALRLQRVDVVGSGWGGLVGRALAAREPRRVRALVTLDAPLEQLDARFRSRAEQARRDPEGLKRTLVAALLDGYEPRRRAWLEQMFGHVPARSLRLAYSGVPLRDDGLELDLERLPLPRQPSLAVSSDADARAPLVHWPEPLRDAERLWSALDGLARESG
jgi:pimeloyl-ACP methyl ester carboxylesterase